MKLLVDFFPILLFFIGYKFYGIYVATVVAMVASLVQVGYFWYRHRKIELTHALTLGLIVVFGMATLFLRNDLFIKWKPTVLYWIMALLFLGSQFFGNRPFIQRLMGEKLVLPREVWRKLNLSWALFFGALGVLNLYVVYHCTTDVWVNFKLFGTLSCTILFGVLQALYMARYLRHPQEQGD